MSQTNWNSLGAFLKSKKDQEQVPTAEESGSPQITEQEPTTRETGLPQFKIVGAHPVVVDAKEPTSELFVGAKEPTTERSGSLEVEIVGAHKRHKNDRHIPGRTRHHIRLPVEISKAFRTFCIQQGIDLQDFVELAGSHYLEYVGAHKSAVVGAKEPIEERRQKIKWKTLTTIVNLYLKYLPGNHWKPRDDKEAERFNGTDLRIIEVAMIAVLIKTQQKRIHSFKYFVEEIEAAMDTELQEETLNVMYSHYVRQYERLKGSAG
ncbi:MAG: hypothetical protein H0W76_15990 [Pyrinomonadaceae bacterium]|nr:hypothetical protein [Pyrinomonadaceae bacterium]